MRIEYQVRLGIVMVAGSFVLTLISNGRPVILGLTIVVAGVGLLLFWQPMWLPWRRRQLRLASRPP